MKNIFALTLTTLLYSSSLFAGPDFVDDKATPSFAGKLRAAGLDIMDGNSRQEVDSILQEKIYPKGLTSTAHGARKDGRAPVPDFLTTEKAVNFLLRHKLTNSFVNSIEGSVDTIFVSGGNTATMNAHGKAIRDVMSKQTERPGIAYLINPNVQPELESWISHNESLKGDILVNPRGNAWNDDALREVVEPYLAKNPGRYANVCNPSTADSNALQYRTLFGSRPELGEFKGTIGFKKNPFSFMISHGYISKWAPTVSENEVSELKKSWKKSSTEAISSLENDPRFSEVLRRYVADALVSEIAIPLNKYIKELNK